MLYHAYRAVNVDRQVLDGSVPSVENCRSLATETAVVANKDAFGPAALREAQLADPILRPVFSWMEDNSEPPSAVIIQAEGRQTKAHVVQWYKLILPLSSQSEIICLAHTGLTGGHLGFKKSLAQVQRRAYWCDWQADVT